MFPETALIGSIYESIGEPDALADMVRKLTSFGESRFTQFGLLDGTGRWVQATIPDADPDVLDAYLRYHVAVDPRNSFYFAPQLEVGREVQLPGGRGPVGPSGWQGSLGG